MNRSVWPFAFPAILAAASCGGGGSPGAKPPVDGGATDGTVGHGDGGSSGGDASSGGHDASATSDGGSGSGGDAGNDSGADSSGGPAVGASVLEYHNHHNRDGYFEDPLVTAASAAKVAYDPTFGATFTGNVWTSPLYVEKGPGGKGTFFVATASNDLHAFDETVGAPAWPSKSFGTPANQSYQGGCGNVQPIGITGTPAIDLATNLIVFDAVSADAGGFIKTHTIYGASILDGSTKWSVDVSTLTDPGGLAFAPPAQNQRGGVLIVNGIAYVVYGGHAGDCGTYRGWVVGVPLSGTGAKAWATQVGGAGIWAPGGAASDGQSIFVATGNGIGGSNTTWQESEGIFRLDPGPAFTGSAPDYFAPNDWASLDGADADISGSGPLVIDAPSMTPSALVLGQGKDGWLYLLKRADLGGISAAQGTANVGAIHVSNGEISNGSAWATVGGATYVVVRPNGNQGGDGCPNGTSGDLVAVKLDPAAPQKMKVAWCASSNGIGSPIITSSDGTKDGLVWVFGAEGDNLLHAFNLADGSVAGTSDAPPVKNGALVHHFATVAEVKGRILVSADDGLYAFKMGP